ncbi:Coagulation factor IX (Fragment) [Seminavis robusta]|uniref:Coagulation factor IX n=1 Tax=Seminavis robusta TaxID=568900 RepID=A0A9N8HNZ5_9STRA
MSTAAGLKIVQGHSKASLGLWLLAAWSLVTPTFCQLMDHQNIRGERNLQFRGNETLITPADDEQHIIGGSPAYEGEFPYFVKFEGGTLCGGSLIAPDRVLTAGHCIQNGWPRQVRVGSHTNSHGQLVPVLCGVRHPNYLTPFVTVLHDVAVLKLGFAVGHLRFADLNTDNNFPSVAGSQMTVMGYGKTSNSGGVSDHLRKLDTNFVTHQECVQKYDATVVRPNAHICGDVWSKGDCNGDSGGPVIDKQTGKQVGLVSFGYGGCASNEYPDVYAKVSSYNQWIQQEISSDWCPAAPSGGGSGALQFCRTGLYLGGAAVYRVGSFFSGLVNFITSSEITFEDR